MRPSKDIAQLLEIMAMLRTPGAGCSWDLSQTFDSIAPFAIEEAYEVAEAIAQNNMQNLCEELGDLLLQVVFHARMAEELQIFNFGDVVLSITEKLIRRHPHIFQSGDQAQQLSSDGVKAQWDEIKKAEKKQKSDALNSRLDSVPDGLPALHRADMLQRAAAKAGFDWPDARGVLDKILEETEEAAQALDKGDRNEIEDEIGDLLFSVVNLARRADVHPDNALRKASAKFSRRFRFIERALAESGKDLLAADLEELDSLWLSAKRREKPNQSGK